MKFLILILIVNVYSYELSNVLFMSNIINNKLILTNYDIDYYDNRTVVIQYETIDKEDINNYDNILEIDNNNISTLEIDNNLLLEINDNNDNIYDNISTIMNINNIILNINYVMNYDVYSIDGNNLNVSIKISNIFNITNKFILSLSFNGPVNFNGINILEIKDYVIIFNDSCKVERFGNYFYIHFETNAIFFVIKYIYNDKLPY